MSQSPEAGWYPDPSDPTNVRFWDGSNWTNEVKPNSEVKISTTDEIFGYRITKFVGPVSEIAGASGTTAGRKGSHALWKAMDGLSKQASSIGANAIVGLQGSAFGAGGGITNMLGGDAVGVLLIGTAVVVEPIS